jgi:hypothetical protein
MPVKTSVIAQSAIELGLFQHALNRAHGCLDVDHDAFFSPRDGCVPSPMMLSSLLGRDLGDDGNDLRRADVEPDDQVFCVSHHATFASASSLSFAGITVFTPPSSRRVP